MRRIKQRQSQQGSHIEANAIASDPHLHHHIGLGEKTYDELGQYLRDHAGDPAARVSKFNDSDGHYAEISHRISSLD